MLGHPASVTRDLQHSLDVVAAMPEVRLTCAFGPQHGMRGDKQDNMVESAGYRDPLHGVPVHSLYGEVRRPTDSMLDEFDVLLVDLQDVGCRIYTFITTLRYMLEGCAAHGKAVWVLDRPNPAGRAVEGLRLQPGWESFVGSGPLPMRHGLTIGELARWFVHHLRLDVDLRVIEMKGYNPHQAPGYGWPVGELSWVNPSPNAAGLPMARAYSGTVMIEGTTLSEGRGTTRPLEIVGAPDLDVPALLDEMQRLRPRSGSSGCAKLRTVLFRADVSQTRRPSCAGLQIHVDHGAYRPQGFSLTGWWPAARKQSGHVDAGLRLVARLPVRSMKPTVWLSTLSNGGPRLREWVGRRAGRVSRTGRPFAREEGDWRDERRGVPDLLRREAEGLAGGESRGFRQDDGRPQKVRCPSARRRIAQEPAERGRGTPGPRPEGTAKAETVRMVKGSDACGNTGFLCHTAAIVREGEDVPVARGGGVEFPVIGVVEGSPKEFEARSAP